MAFFSELATQIDVLRRALGGDVESDQLPRALDGLDDDQLVAVLDSATVLGRVAEKVRIAASGVAGARSTRDAGHEGLAQKRGHRSPASLIQELTGATRAEAAMHLRLGESLRTAAGIGAMADAVASRDATDELAPWHAVLGRALLAGTISSAQHDAILQGLGTPPIADSPDDQAAVRVAWGLAAEQLVAEAQHRTVEELSRTARTVRDHLDPDGARRRFDERFERRSFRLWTDADGLRRGSIVFDDMGGAWTQTVMDAALRPRRGGPRFVDPEEQARAEELIADPRTNEQLAYDLLVDVLRSGALADAASVFGARQAGVRVIVPQGVLKGEDAVGMLEDDRASIPAWLARQHVCDTGAMECTLDGAGNPLDLGREARIFSPKQKIALAVRDGGCRWRHCDRPASYCEAHHIDPYSEGGRTDIDRGILLCRFHHMQLHHGGWRITRAGRGDFTLHPPPGSGDPVVLVPRLGLRYARGDVDPPPRRFRPAA
ncbi:HNH endonuclease signature motif containing protein [uncultured Microbacterium sp.]|uniref:HNH endonuclease signature motif containing protein n=1 Tax=uncultured Microbacterium sp. TaxID=191216 RepID=UPI0035CA9E2D